MVAARNPLQKKIERLFWNLLRLSGKSQLWTDYPAKPEFPTQTSVDRKNLRLHEELDAAMKDLREISARAELLGPCRYTPRPPWKSWLVIYWARLRGSIRGLASVATVWWCWIAVCTVLAICTVYNK